MIAGSTLRAWKTVELGELSTSRLGKMLSPASKGGAPEFPYFGNAEVRWGWLKTANLRTMAFSEAERKEFELLEGDVLICEGGEVGRSALVERDLPGVFFQKAIHRVRCNEQLSPRYLQRFMEFAAATGRLDDYSSQATIKHLTGVKLRRLPIPLPPIEEQRRIAAVLDAADALRGKRRQAIAKLDTLTQAIFIDMFGDPTLSADRWHMAAIGELLESATYGTSKKAGATGAYPVLRMGNLTARGRFDLADLKYMDLEGSETKKHLVYAGDVLFNRTNSAALVGKTAVYREPTPMAYAGYLIRLRPGSDLNAEYLGAYMNLPSTKQRLRSMCKSIVGMANINATEVKGITIPVPPISEQDEFATKCEGVRTSERGLASQAEALDDLFASLQQRAFWGEL